MLIYEGSSIVNFIMYDYKKILRGSPPGQLLSLDLSSAPYFLSIVRGDISECVFFRLRHCECPILVVGEKQR